MNILITGIHGFVGSNLVKAMGGKHAIYGLDILAPDTVELVKKFTWEELNNKNYSKEVVTEMYVKLVDRVLKIHS